MLLDEIHQSGGGVHRPAAHWHGARHSAIQRLGAISQSLGGISERVKRAEDIERKLVEGQVVVELDPALVDNSFVPDRMDPTEAQNAAFREIIRQHGQNVPILVRRKPGPGTVRGRLWASPPQGLPGTRNRRCAPSSARSRDEELVVAQGQENNGRTDLTFIERARFAARLEERGFSREIIMSALNVDKAALSRLISVATRIPPAVIEAIGPAPAYGRVRWQELDGELGRGRCPARAFESHRRAASLAGHGCALRHSCGACAPSATRAGPKLGSETTARMPPEFHGRQKI